MTSPEYSPLSCSVAKVLELLLNEEGIGRGQVREDSEYCIASYRDNFDYIWGIGDHEESSLIEDLDEGQEQETTIILIHDEVPRASRNTSSNPFNRVNAADYISAYDWAVYLLLSLPSDRGVRLLILDETSREIRSPSAAEAFPALLPSMPWVRVCGLFGLRDFQKPFEEKQSGLISTGLTGVADALTDQQFCSYAQTDTSLTNTAQELALETWRNHLTKPGRRHDVSNLIAPLVLARGFHSGEYESDVATIGGDRRREALEKLLQTLGILDSQDDNGKKIRSPLESEMVEQNIFGQFDRVRFLLVDDLADHGYHDAVASLLFGTDIENEGELVTSSSNQRFTLRSVQNPDLLIEKIFGAVGMEEDSQDHVEVSWGQPREVGRSPMSEEHDEDREFDILLLDLRLFGGSNTGRGEANFLRRLVDFYKRSEVQKIEDEDLKRAYEAAQAELESEEDSSLPEQKESSRRPATSSGGATDIMHLALLPLLLSHVDPSLPIVVFSSTRQRAITDVLDNRPGIITTFRKPVASGYMEGLSPAGYSEKLSEALSKALQLNEARCIWTRLTEIEWGESPAFEVQEDDDVMIYNVDEFSKRKEELKKIDVNLIGSKNCDPKVKGEELQKRLSTFYVKYVVEENHTDFALVPNRFLEMCLMPDEVLNKVDRRKPVITIHTSLEDRNRIHRIYEELRNKIVHGHGGESIEEREGWILSTFIFLLFVEFIEVKTTDKVNKGTLQNMEDVKATIRDSSDNLKNLRNIKSIDIVNNREADLLDCLTFLSLYYLKSYRENLAMESITVRSLHNLTVYVGRKGPIETRKSKINSQEKAVGTIKKIDDTRGQINKIESKDKLEGIHFRVENQNEVSQEEVGEGDLFKFEFTGGDRLEVKENSMEPFGYS
jgi:hypothetical protein